MKYHKNGFTLIELMIVVGIIGILAGIAIPAYQNQIEKGRRSDCQANMTAAANAMERFRTGAGQGSYATAAVGAGGGIRRYLSSGWQYHLLHTDAACSDSEYLYHIGYSSRAYDQYGQNDCYSYRATLLV